MADTLETQFAAARLEMVAQIALHVSFASEQIGTRSLAQRVIEAIATVPRHEFVPAEIQVFAYSDQPLPIGFGKTISQPFIVALMTQLLDIQPEDRVLEIGTGLGYHAAVLARLAKTVYTVEIIQELAREAEDNLRGQSYTNIMNRIGDGSYGWAEHAPFDKIVVAAAPELIPPSLLNQLKAGGKMVVPAGIENAQQLVLVEKDDTGSTHTKEILPVVFAPLITTH